MKPEDASNVPDLLLERFRLDEVSPGERSHIEHLLRTDETTRHRLEALQRSDEELAGSGLHSQLSSRIEAETRNRARLRERRNGVAPLFGVMRWAAVGVAAMLVLFVASTRRPDVPSNADGDRIKGLKPSLSVFRQVRGASEVVHDGAIAHEGDLLRLAYQAAGRPYGAILSLDGARRVTLHLPAAGSQAAARLSPGDTVLLEEAYELDAAPGWECFYFITAKTPFELGAVIEAAKWQARHANLSRPSPLALGRDLEQSLFYLVKEQKQ